MTFSRPASVRFVYHPHQYLSLVNGHRCYVSRIINSEDDLFQLFQVSINSLEPSYFFSLCHTHKWSVLSSHASIINNSEHNSRDDFLEKRINTISSLSLHLVTQCLDSSPFEQQCRLCKTLDGSESTRLTTRRWLMTLSHISIATVWRGNRWLAT